MEAEKLLDDNLVTRRRVLGPEHPQTLDVFETSLNFTLNSGDTTKQRDLCTEALQLCRSVLGVDHPDFLD